MYFMRTRPLAISRLLVVAAAIALCVSPVVAQQTLGGITGSVTDSSGNVIPNVAVSVVDEQTSLARTAKTSDSGSYSFVNLPIGTYTLTFTLGRRDSPSGTRPDAIAPDDTSTS